jgi:hypothetical protein
MTMYTNSHYNGYCGNAYEASPPPNRRYLPEGSVSAAQAKQFLNQLADLQLTSGQLVCNARIVSVADNGAMRYVVSRKNIPYLIEGHSDNILQISQPGGLCCHKH